MSTSPYHSKIVAIENDIAILNATLGTAGELESLDSTQSSCCKSLSTNLGSVATPANLAVLKDKASSFNKTVATRTSTIISLTREERDSLNSTLQILKSADQDWKTAQAAKN